MHFELLDNVAWHSLNGAHQPFASGGTEALRYVPGFSPIIAFADTANPRFDQLEAVCQVGEQFYSDAWRGDAPRGWKIELQADMYKMVWAGGPAPVVRAEGLEIRALTQADVPAVMDITTRLKPGPFGPRTIELGTYIGLFDGGKLASMAGERFCARPFREISGVCTDHEYQGRGYARLLMNMLIGQQLGRGEVPFLHAITTNTHAVELYRKMGFEVYKSTPLQITRRL